MAILPLQMSRVTELLKMQTSTQSIESTQSQLLTVENEIDTGQTVSVVSDNPTAAQTIMELQRTLARRVQFNTNITTTTTQLGTVDSSLSSLSNLLLQATSLASANVGSDVTDAQRQSASQVAQSYITEAMTLANTSVQGSYLFGGDKNQTAPFVNTVGGIQFVGSSTLQKNVYDENTVLNAQVDGASVFGALSSRVTGTADLTPAVSAQTRIIDLRGAGSQGVTLGPIVLGNGTTSKTVDLSQADTLGDVVSAINSAGIGGITASLTSNGITLTGANADDITVTDPNGSTTAADLGIQTSGSGAGAGTAVNGSPLNARLTMLTPLSALKNGAGIDSAGLTITNGQITKTITVPGSGTVEDLLNAINGSKLGITATIDSSGQGIDVMNATQGVTLSIGENGGTTAADLGIRSFSPSTSLSDLNNGNGIAFASGGDFAIKRTDGSSFNVSLTGAKTIQDVIDDINNADGGRGVRASFATAGNGLVLTDSSGGNGTLSVTAINNSLAAKQLGLTNPATGNTISGGDVNQVQATGVFSDLQALVTALQKGDQAGITAAGGALQDDYSRVVDARASAGAQVQSLTDRQTQLTSENTATQSLLSSLQDTNFTEAISQFQSLQTALQGALETTAKVSSLSLLSFLQ